MTLRLRPLTPQDAPATHAIFLAAVAGTHAVYTKAQRQAWAAGLADPADWVQRTQALEGFVALWHETPMGFMALRDGGYLDMAFVHPKAAGQGLGRALLAEVTALARARGAREMTTHASLAAAPFLAKQGWHTIAQEAVRRSGIDLPRAVMRRPL